MIRLALCLLLLLAPATTWAGGGSTSGSSHRNCATSEPAINAASTTILCDDFERNGSGGTPGTWYGVHCDQNGTGGAGEGATESKGWCGSIFAPSCITFGCALYGAGLGANGTLGTARSVLSGSAEALATHNFPTTCATGGLNCTLISGMAHYDQVYMRAMVRIEPGFSFGQNQKLFTINPCCTGTGGILLNGPGMANADPTLPTCPVVDCNWLDTYRNPQNNLNSQYLGQNAGNGILSMGGARLGRWTAIEYRMRVNTADVQDGLWDLWMDDCGTAGTTCPATQTLRAHYTNIRYRGAIASNSTTKIGSIFLDTWTGDSSGTIKIDQFVVSTQQIGWMGATVTPPAAFSVLATQGTYATTGVAATLTRLVGPTLIGFVHRAALLVTIVALLILIGRSRNVHR